MSNIFSRNSLLYGQDFADKLTNAKIAICGVGAVGSVVAEALARLGVGTFFLFDFELHLQILYGFDIFHQ